MYFVHKSIFGSGGPAVCIWEGSRGCFEFVGFGLNFEEEEENKVCRGQTCATPCFFHQGLSEGVSKSCSARAGAGSTGPAEPCSGTRAVCLVPGPCTLCAEERPWRAAQRVLNLCARQCVPVGAHACI